MFCLFLKCVEILLLLSSRNLALFNLGLMVPIPLFSSENDAFSAMCDVCRLKPIKAIFWSTNTLKYLYSFLVYMYSTK